MQQIKLIAMDMDGTLLIDTQKIPPENLLALRQAQQHGVQLAICSGRTARDISYFISDAGLTSCYILAMNGACCLDKPHGEPYAVHTIAAGSVQRTTEILLRHKVSFACFQPDRVIVVLGDEHVNKLHWGTHVARGNVNAYAYGVEALKQYGNEPVCKMVYIDTEENPRIEVIRRELVVDDGLLVTSSWSNNLEIMPKGISKGGSLRSLAQRLGIPAAQVMAIGDYDNDLDMIQYAGFGVAMGNGSQRVKDAARYTTLAFDQFGVAEAIRELVLPAYEQPAVSPLG